MKKLKLMRTRRVFQIKLSKLKYPDAKIYVVSANEESNSGTLQLKDFLKLTPDILF